VKLHNNFIAAFVFMDLVIILLPLQTMVKQTTYQFSATAIFLAASTTTTTTTIR
jgi:hypothetical protein